MDRSVPRAAGDFRTPVAVYLVAGLFVLAELVTGPRYGIFRDELYYLACASHLAWGYVDQPAFSIGILAGVRALLGDGLLAVRLVPALLGGVLVLLAARLARELGGGRFAQGLAALAVAVAPQYLGLASFYSMNAFDLVFWSAGALLLVLLVKTDDPRLWLPMGLVLGFGLENKISVLVFAFGLAVAVVATPLRRHLRSWQLWAGAGIALALFLPYVLWQTTHEWATLEFMRNATRYKNVGLSPLAFLGAQLRDLHPFNAPLWIGGLVWLLGGREGRRFRALAFLYLAALAVMLSTRSKPYYLSPAYQMLLAAGAVAAERFFAARQWGWARPWSAGLLLLGGLLTAPLAIPVFSVDGYLAYSHALGIRPHQQEHAALGRLPQFFADRFGWREMTAAVAKVYDSLTPEERGRTIIVTSNYGEAGAIDYFGPAHGLPHAWSQHNSYYFWRPSAPAGDPIVLSVGISPDDLRESFDSVEEAGRWSDPDAMPYETRQPILICRGSKLPLAEAWKRGRHFI